MANGLQELGLDQTGVVKSLMDVSPSGWKTTLMDEKRLRSLESAPVNELSNIVAEYGKNKITEKDVIQKEAVKVANSYLTPDGIYDLPGLMLALDNKHLQKFAAAYVGDADTPSGNVAPVELADSSDTIFTFATPEVWDEIASDPDNNGSSTGKNNFLQDSLTAGNTLDLIADGGIDSSTSSSDTTLTLNQDEYLFFTGDVIDLSGNGCITKLKITNKDGESDYGPSTATLQERASDARVLTGQGAFIQNEVDVDAKVYQDGDAELVPIVFYMGPGTKAPGLTLPQPV